MTTWVQKMEKAVSDLSMRNEVLERRLYLLRHAIETTIEDPVTRSEVRQNLQRYLVRSEALAAGRAEDDVRPIEREDGNIKCQYCGCLTNAKLRACCEQGREQDLRISKSKTADFLDVVQKPKEEKESGQPSLREALVDALEDLVKALDRPQHVRLPQAASPEDLRAKGWMVVCHNDYRQNTLTHTFWSFSKGTTYVCGEGLSDADALEQVRAKVQELEKAPTT